MKSKIKCEATGFHLQLDETGRSFRVMRDIKSSVLPPRVESTSEELANTISHAIGFVASVIGAPILLVSARCCISVRRFYHVWPGRRGKSFWRVIDHSAIFLLIAGTYTPFGLGPLRQSGGLIMLGAVWLLAGGQKWAIEFLRVEA